MNVFPGSCRLAITVIDDRVTIVDSQPGQPTSQSNAPVKEGQRAEGRSRPPSASEAEIGAAFSRE
jgi:hypothetical protein